MTFPPPPPPPPSPPSSSSSSSPAVAAAAMSWRAVWCDRQRAGFYDDASSISRILRDRRTHSRWLVARRRGAQSAAFAKRRAPSLRSLTPKPANATTPSQYRDRALYIRHGLIDRDNLILNCKVGDSYSVKENEPSYYAVLTLRSSVNTITREFIDRYRAHFARSAGITEANTTARFASWMSSNGVTSNLGTADHTLEFFFDKIWICIVSRIHCALLCSRKDMRSMECHSSCYPALSSLLFYNCHVRSSDWTVPATTNADVPFATTRCSGHAHCNCAVYARPSASADRQHIHLEQTGLFRFEKFFNRLKWCILRLFKALRIPVVWGQFWGRAEHVYSLYPFWNRTQH